MRILRTFSEIAVARGYRVFVMALTIHTVNSDGKRISKTFGKIAVCLGYQERHHKQVPTQEMCKIRKVN